MAYPLDRSILFTLERITPSVELDVPAGIQAFLLNFPFVLPIIDSFTHAIPNGS
jgi:hypothetical protein